RTGPVPGRCRQGTAVQQATPVQSNKILEVEERTSSTRRTLAVELEPQKRHKEAQMNSQNAYRLSPPQRHVWSFQQAEQQRSPYRVQCVVNVRGEIDTATLKSAIASVVKRHDILRATFCGTGAGPLQVINDNAEFYFDELDSSAPNPEALEFDLEHGPTLHVWFARSCTQEHKLIVALPALCADAVTLQNLIAEIALAYEADEVTDEPLQYVATAQWLNDLLESEETSAGREYWHKQNSPAPVSLSMERPLRVKSDFRPQVITCAIDSDVADLARRHDVDVADCLFAAWAILISRHSGQEEIGVGRAFNGRTEQELENAFGLLTRYLPLQLQVNGSFTELVRQVSRVSNEAGAWQEMFNWEHSTDCYFDYTESHSSARFQIVEQYTCIDRFKIA